VTRAAPRPHGTNAKRTKERCDCEPCCEAGRRYERHRSKLRIMGRVAYVDAGAAREHVQALLRGGMTVRQVEAASGVDRTSIRVMLGGFPGRKASKRIRPATAAALLSVLADPYEPVGDATVDGAGTRRRLQALLANGYTGRDLTRRLGSGPATKVVQVGRSGRVRADTARRVRELYEQLEHTEGPSSRAQIYYRGLGFLPPAWWDPDTIDDPAAEPEGLRSYRSGDLLDDVSAPRVERVARMAARGLDVDQIAAVIGCEVRYVRRDLRERDEVAAQRSRSAASGGVDLGEVEHLEAGGCSLEEIARRMGVQVESIERARQRAAEREAS
jgi:hypothetical protein